jgi:hypothetical protein
MLRNARGVEPVCFLKAVLKLERLLNPDFIAIADMV